MQRNWIGRSEGAEFDLDVQGRDGSDGRPALAIRVFTTRPDTSFGMTYVVLAPEHPLVDELTTADQRAAVDAIRRPSRGGVDIERTIGRRLDTRQRGAFTGCLCRQPVSSVIPCRSTWPTTS